jgi:hypothetical protein
MSKQKYSWGYKDYMLMAFGLCFLLAFMGYYTYVDHQDKAVKKDLGIDFCDTQNLSFDYTHGEYIDCYYQDNATGIKTKYSYWVDWDVIKQKYN